ncbi:MAG: hypothetical protein DRJ11_11220 [Candidatus Aminicenantes bacterium]|nr:MAG: hypothetical protein DRJ11_11220 [Candidatus Aminicenantes bacterium]
MEASTLTALRTGAACGLATELLSRPESRKMALFGAVSRLDFNWKLWLRSRAWKKFTSLTRTGGERNNLLNRCLIDWNLKSR